MLYQLIYLIIVVGLLILAFKVGFVLLLFALVGFLAGFAYNYLLVPLLGTPLLPIHNFWVLILLGVAVWVVFRR